MIVVPEHKAVVLNLRDRARIMAVIPTAKEFTHQGNTLLAVPHRMDEVRVLRNLGINVPGPMRHYYKWPGRFTPFAAQYETAEFLTFNAKAFVLNDLGTGKTLAALWAWDYLRSIHRAARLLVISPLSTLERAWGDEIFQNFPHLEANVLYGVPETRLKLLAQDADIYIINHDGIKNPKVLAALLARKDIDTVIVDEIASFRNSQTDRWKTLNKVLYGRQRVWGMTGTPTPNLPTDAWAQCRLICPENVPKYFGQFRNQVLRRIGQFTWVPEPDSAKRVAEVMRPAVRFTRDQCVDLPPCIYQTRHVALTDVQDRMYKEMIRQLKAEYAGEEVLAVNEGVKMAKLVQICCGVAYDDAGDDVIIPTGPRTELVSEIIEEAGSKVIVFVPFRGALKAIQEELSKRWTVERIDGQVSKGERDRIYSAFQRSSDPHIIVAQPGAMSHGLTLTEASTIIWYAPITSNETYQQANGRITRPGQKQTQFIINIEGSEVERRIFARLQSKEKLQGMLLKLLKET
jgi:SNF2 family DNA or RNA helicase